MSDYRSHAELVHHHAVMLRNDLTINDVEQLRAARVWIGWALNADDPRTLEEIAADAEAAKCG